MLRGSFGNFLSRDRKAVVPGARLAELGEDRGKDYLDRAEVHGKQPCFEFEKLIHTEICIAASKVDGGAVLPAARRRQARSIRCRGWPKCQPRNRLDGDADGASLPCKMEN